MDISTARRIFNENESVEGAYECDYLEALRLLSAWKSTER